MIHRFSTLRTILWEEMQKASQFMGSTISALDPVVRAQGYSALHSLDFTPHSLRRI